MANRIPSPYRMSNSDLFSSDSSSENGIDDHIYRNLQPFRMENFITDEIMPISQYRRHIDIRRPQSMTNCKKCSQIRTNPRFRPSSYQCYGKSSNERNLFESNDDESSDDQISFQKPSFSKIRQRRFRYKNHTR